MVVSEILTKNNIDFKPKGQDFVVTCLNPEHEDNNPSMHIDQTEGTFHWTGFTQTKRDFPVIHFASEHLMQ